MTTRPPRPIAALTAFFAIFCAACAGGDPMDERPARAILMLDDGWGANVTLDDEAPGILAQLEAMGWELTIVSCKPSLKPCGFANRSPRTASVKVQKLARDIDDATEYDALVVAPGKGFSGLVADRASLDLVRRADQAGLAIAAFCRGARVLAAAGILEGRTMTGHPDYRDEYLAAGARFIDYADRGGKTDAPPPVVDGFLVTSLRSKYYRTAICEAIMTAAGNARRARADRFASARATGPAAARAETALFAFMLTPDVAREAVLLAGSLREWGGALKGSPVLCMVPGSVDAVPEPARARLSALACELAAFGPDPRIDGFPLASKAGAAAEAERLTAGRADALVWMDPDTVIVREPSELLLPAGAVVAAAPVHHRLVGLPWGAEPDAYWKAVYAACGADAADDFPVASVIDREPIRPYFNAGLVVVRPEAGMLRAWRDNLAAACADPAVLGALRSATALHRVFLHQAALAATIVSRAGPGGFYELSLGYNYPAHMHASCPPALAPKKLDDLYTVRYDEWSLVPGSAGCGIPSPPRMAAALSSLRE